MEQTQVDQRQISAKTILVAGSKREISGNSKEFEDACRVLGNELAVSEFQILVGSFDDITADYFVLEGALRVKNARCRVIRPEDAKASEFDHRVQIDSRPGNWQVVRPQQVNSADAVILIAGSQGTHQIFNLAKDAGIPVVLIPAFGGATGAVYPNYKTHYLSQGITRETLDLVERTAYPVNERRKMRRDPAFRVRIIVA